MKKTPYFLKLSILNALVILMATGFYGCAPSVSTGFDVYVEAAAGFPSQVPQKVVMIPLTGDVRFSDNASDQFVDRMRLMGFEVIDCEQLFSEKILDKFSQDDELNEATRFKLWEKYNAEGAILGRIHCKEEVKSANVSLDLQIISMQTGDVIWKAQFSDSKKLRWKRETGDLLAEVVDEIADALEADLGDELKNQKRERRLQDKTAKAVSKKEARDAKTAEKNGEEIPEEQPTQP